MHGRSLQLEQRVKGKHRTLNGTVTNRQKDIEPKAQFIRFKSSSGVVRHAIISVVFIRHRVISIIQSECIVSRYVVR